MYIVYTTTYRLYIRINSYFINEWIYEIEEEEAEAIILSFNGEKNKI